MPIYDYRCRACSTVFEALESSGWPGPTPCPRCGNDLTDRLLSAPHGRVKGQGWKDGSGGPDQYTADTLGIPLKELPPGLRTKK